jgi:hypothetical protein
MRSFEIYRAQKLIGSVINKLELDLKDLKILTEAGSNYFSYSPLIAYYAGASKIFVWIKDTSYGAAIDIQMHFETILKNLKIKNDKFEFALNERPVEHIETADIITNLGFVRPIDHNFLRHMKKDAVVSYMCEAWEIRDGDVDINYCKERNIKIAGVWENHPDLMIFKGCGNLSIKLCLEAGLEVYLNKILILSSDKFGQTAYNAFLSVGAEEVKIRKPEEANEIDYTEYDIVFVADYTYKEEILGKNNFNKLAELKNVAIVHLCGSVDYEWLNAQQIYCYPQQQGYHSRMTKTLAHLGLKPVVDLHTAGMKVGECLYKNKNSEFIQLL